MSSEPGGGDRRGLSGDLAWAPPLPAHRKASCRMKNAPQSLPQGCLSNGAAKETGFPGRADNPGSRYGPASARPGRARCSLPIPVRPPGSGAGAKPPNGAGQDDPPALCPQGSRGAAGCCHCSVFVRAAWCRALYPRFQSLFGANYIPLPPFPFSILPVLCVWEIMQPGGPKSAATPPTLAWSHGEADPPWPCPGG